MAGDGAGPGDEIELAVDGIATGGDGVGREPDGRVVFVPRAAPGDRVRVRLETARSRWARGRLVEVLEPGPGRRCAPCPVYDRCGGCALQHLTAPAQRAARREVVRETLRRIGGIEIEVPPVEHEAEELGYRNRVRFALRREPGGVRAGFRALGRPGEVVDVEDCPLAEAPIRRAWRGLRAAWGPQARALPAGSELELVLRGNASGEVALHVLGADRTSDGEPTAVAEGVPGLVSYTREDESGRQRVLAGEEVLLEEWQDLRFRLGPGVFLQANRRVSERIDAWIDARIGDPRGLRVADLYAGVGARAIRWALAGARTSAVEANRAACRAGRRTAREVGARLRFLEGRVEDHAAAARTSDLVVANPPRTGLSRQVATALTGDVAARRMVYVSCDPATLARDLARLAARWSPVAVGVFDAFPQTGHVETVVDLTATQETGASEGSG
jgi:23S rRNA (uracil1939-C5)-methyltransferase